jgi:beta-phosphoglucomutase-like phosphatase (HAD superfamily)
MPIRALIFDLGGVLVRTEDPTSRLKLAEKLG